MVFKERYRDTLDGNEGTGNEMNPEEPGSIRYIPISLLPPEEENLNGLPPME